MLDYIILRSLCVRGVRLDSGGIGDHPLVSSKGLYVLHYSLSLYLELKNQHHSWRLQIGMKIIKFIEKMSEVFFSISKIYRQYNRAKRMVAIPDF